MTGSRLAGMPVTLEIEAKLPARFLAWGSLLGMPIPFKLGGRRATIQFPPYRRHSEVGVFSPEYSTLFFSEGKRDDLGDYGCVVPKATLRIEDPMTCRSSDYLPPNSKVGSSEWERLEALFLELLHEGQHFLVNLVSLIRTTPGQHLLGPASAQFTFITIRMYDGEGVQLPMEGSNVSDQYGLEPLQPLDLDSLMDLIDRTTMHERPDPADTLLADAFYGLVSSSDPRLAVMQAAMAAERRIKTFLQERAIFGQRELVELIVNSPRDVTVQAVGLYDKGLKAVVGRSFREDDKEGYKMLVKLFEERNKFAHRDSSVLTRDQARQLVRAARAAGEYLNEVEKTSPQYGHRIHARDPKS